MRLLSLDLSTRTGWATHIDGAIEHGTWRLRSIGRPPPTLRNDLGTIFSRLAAALEDTCQRLGIDWVDYEAPLSHAALAQATSEDNARLIHGLVGVVLMVCHEQGVPRSRIGEVTPERARKSVLGMARPGKNREEIKSNVVTWCRSQKFDVCDDNAADAVVLLHHRLILNDPLLIMERWKLGGNS